MRKEPMGLAPSEALFLDFDGTLAPLQDDPASVALPEGGAEILSRLAEALGGALAVVTGRGIGDISERVPAQFWRAGNHGLAIAPPCAPVPDLPTAPEALIAAARAETAVEGIWLEEKGPVLALHTRARPELAQEIADRMAAIEAEGLGYRLECGKGIIEFKPKAANKGTALLELLEQDPFKGRSPLFIGDDTTDEDGFAAALSRGGRAIKVGDGDSQAPFGLADPGAVWNWLERSANELT